MLKTNKYFLQFSYAAKCFAYFPVTFIKRVLLGRDQYWKQYFWNKWGFLPKELFKKIARSQVIWIDALGGGEVTQLITFTKLLKKEYPDFKIILSTNNHKPFYFARTINSIDFVFDIPWDLGFVVEPVLRCIKPKILIVIDQVRFPVILRAAKKFEIKTILVSAALVRNYHLSSYMRRAMAFRYFDYFDLIGVTDEADKEAYLALGADSRRIRVSGNMKYDLEFLSVSVSGKEDMLREAGLNKDDFIFVAGSVHPAEEKVLLEGFKKAKESINQLKLILAPRYIKDVPLMQESISSLGLDYILRSRIKNASSKTSDIILVDTFGELGRFYSLASVIFIGNSIFPRDQFALGQNIIEPLVQLRPVLFGPHMNKWKKITQELKEVWPNLEIRNADELCLSLQNLFLNRALFNSIVAKSAEIVERNKNSVQNNFLLVKEALQRYQAA